MKKTVEDYLALGMDRPIAEYYASGRKQLTAVSPNPNFTLTLTYDHREKRLLDMRPTLAQGGVFAFLRQWENFRRVRLGEMHAVTWDIDPAVDSSVVWDNVIDLCPDSCYVDSVPFSPT